MILWLLTFLVFLIAVLAMATGFIMAKKPIAGSCGGLNKLGLKKDCPVCGEKVPSYQSKFDNTGENKTAITCSDAAIKRP